MSKIDIDVCMILMCVLCPVASSITVVASMLGANPARTTTYTIIGNLLVCIIAPIYISIIMETSANTSFGSMFMMIFTMIFAKIVVVIALPFILMIYTKKYLSRLNAGISAYKQFSFYLWAVALFITIGQTIDFVTIRWRDNLENVIWLGVISLVICIGQFYTLCPTLNGVSITPLKKSRRR